MHCSLRVNIQSERNARPRGPWRDESPDSRVRVPSHLDGTRRTANSFMGRSASATGWEVREARLLLPEGSTSTSVHPKRQRSRKTVLELLFRLCGSALRVFDADELAGIAENKFPRLGFVKTYSSLKRRKRLHSVYTCALQEGIAGL